MLSILIIGAGTMGTAHARSYQAMENVKLVGIVDINKQKAYKLAKEGTETFSSFEEAVEKLERVDVVDVCIPTYLHKEYVKKAATLGKHVICEKPLARTLEDAVEMVNFCKEQDVKLFVGHVVRFFPEYNLAKRVLESGEIGKPGVVRTSRGGGFPNAWRDWYADYQSSGGLILDLIIHDFDYLRWCFGDVERVYAKSLLGRGYARMEYALVTLKFKSGVIAHVEGSWAHEGFSTKLEIAGDKGAIEFDSSKERPFTATIKENRVGNNGVNVPKSPLKESPYYRELKHFIHCIETGDQPLVSAEDACKAVEIAMAALRSIETSQAVHIND
jgi:UDP-N-acetylglucosamine 3-dehydrogenase